MSFLLKKVLVLILIIKQIVGAENTTDESTLSNFRSIRQTHLNLNITIDFTGKK